MKTIGSSTSVISNPMTATGDVLVGGSAGSPMAVNVPRTNAYFYNGGWSTQPVDSYTKLLLHMNGAVDSTTFYDVTGKTVTNNSNLAKIKNIGRFGTGSAYFVVANSYLSIPDSDDFYFGTGDFTIDCWIHPTATSSNYPSVFNQWTNGGGSSDNAILIHCNNSYPSVDIANQGASGAAASITSSKILTLNTWTHIAVVRYGTNVALYMDGLKVGNATLSANFSVNNCTRPINIGGFSVSSSTSMFPGYIDELRVSKGIARWTSNFQPPTAPYGSFVDPGLTAPGDMLVGQNNTTAKLPVGPTGSVLVSDGQTVQWELPANDIDRYVKALFHFDESPAQDVSGTNKTLDLTGGGVISTAKYKFGKSSLYLNGTYARIAGDVSDFEIGRQDFTFEAWIYTVANISNGTRFGFDGAVGGTYTGFCILEISAGTPTLYISSNGTSWDIVSSKSLGTNVVGGWSHIAVSKKGSNIYCFRDGIQISNTTGITSVPMLTSTGFFLGRSQAHVTSNMYVDEFRWSKGICRYVGGTNGVQYFIPKQVPFQKPVANIYNPLTTNGDLVVADLYGNNTKLGITNQCQQLTVSGQDLTYSQAQGIDSNTKLLLHGNAAYDVSPVAKTVTNSAVKVSAAKCLFDGQSLYFDGVAGTNLLVKNQADFDFKGNDFTIDFWMYPTVLGAEAMILFGSSNYHIGAYLNASNKMNFSLSANGSSWTTATTATSIVINKWVHVACIRNGGYIYIYLNGKQDVSAACTISVISNADDLYLGRSNSDASRYTGYLQEFRISNVARWTANFVPPTTPYGPAVPRMNVADAYTQLLVSDQLLDMSSSNKTLTLNGNAKFVTNKCVSGSKSMYFDNTITSAGTVASCISIPTSSDFDLSASNGTIDFWLYLTALPPTGKLCTLMSLSDLVSSARTVAYIDSDGNIWLGIYNDTYINTSTGANTIPLGTWSHIAITKNSTTTTIYVNGVSKVSSTSSVWSVADSTFYIGLPNTTTVTLFTAATTVFYIDEFRWSKGLVRWASNFTVPRFTGLTNPLSDAGDILSVKDGKPVAIKPVSNANSVLVNDGGLQFKQGIPVEDTNTLLLLHGNGSNIIDSSCWAKTISVTNVVTSATQSKFGSSSLYFSNGTLTISDSVFTLNDFTIEMWVYLADLTTKTFVKYGTTNTCPDFSLVFDSVNGLTFNATRSISQNSIRGWAINTWTNICVSRTGSTVNLFVDGDVVATTKLSDVIGGGQTLTIGPILGYVDELRISNVGRYITNYVPQTVPFIDAFPTLTSLTVGSPTGNYMGEGSLNAETLYDDGSQLTCYPLEYELTGELSSMWDNVVGTTRYKALLNAGINPNNVDQYISWWKTNGHLLSMPQKTDRNGLAIGDYVQRITETVDLFAIHLAHINDRLTTLEAQG